MTDELWPDAIERMLGPEWRLCGECDGDGWFLGESEDGDGLMIPCGGCDGGGGHFSREE